MEPHINLLGGVARFGRLTIYVPAFLQQRRKTMNYKRTLYQMLVLLIVVGLLAGYNDTSAKPTTIAGSEMPFSVGNFKLQITSVKLGGSMFAPAGMAKDETVLTVEIKVLSGDPKTVAKTDGEFDVWTTDDTGRRNSSRAGTAMTNESGNILSIKWLFGVAKRTKSFYLNFPSGVTVDLAPLLP
jgi:hypothetical protein